jgi:hypothetical protein
MESVQGFRRFYQDVIYVSCNIHDVPAKSPKHVFLRRNLLANLLF